MAEIIINKSLLHHYYELKIIKIFISFQIVFKLKILNYDNK